MIEMTCPHCKKRYRLDERYGGRAVKCKACSGSFQVVSAAPERAAYVPEGYELVEDDNTAAPESRITPPPLRKADEAVTPSIPHRNVWITLASLLAVPGLVALGGAPIWLGLLLIIQSTVATIVLYVLLLIGATADIVIALRAAAQMQCRWLWHAIRVLAYAPLAAILVLMGATVIFFEGEGWGWQQTLMTATAFGPPLICGIGIGRIGEMPAHNEALEAGQPVGGVILACLAAIIAIPMTSHASMTANVNEETAHVGELDDHAAAFQEPQDPSQARIGVNADSGGASTTWTYESGDEPKETGRPDIDAYGQFRLLFDEIGSSRVYDDYHSAYDRGIARARVLMEELRYEYRAGELTGDDVKRRIANWEENFEDIESHLGQLRAERSELESELERLREAFGELPDDKANHWLQRLPKPVEGATLDGARLLGKPPVRLLGEYQQVVDQLRTWHTQAQKDVPLIDSANQAHAEWRVVAEHNERMRTRINLETARDERGRPVVRVPEHMRDELLNRREGALLDELSEKLHMARLHLQGPKPDVGRQMLREIVSEAPTSEPAEIARRTLKEIGEDVGGDQGEVEGTQHDPTE